VVKCATLTFPTNDIEKDRLIEHADSVRCTDILRGEICDGGERFTHYLFKFQNRRTIKSLTKIIIYEEMWRLYEKISDYNYFYHKIEEDSISEVIIGENPDSKEKSWLTKEDKKIMLRNRNRIHSNNYYYRNKGVKPKPNDTKSGKNDKEKWKNTTSTKSQYQTKIKNIEEYCQLFPNDRDYFSHFLEKNVIF
jgi:hypothetical protein